MMFSLLSQYIKDASVLRRLQFSAKFYPQSVPNYWESLALFSVKNKEERNGLTPDLARQIIENLEVIDSGALSSDRDLMKEIVSMKKGGNDDPLGVVLISDKVNCRYCRSRLYIRSDRSMKVTIYDDNMGTLPGTHYTKYCRKRGCSFQQHYGYYSQGDTGDVKYDQDWSELPYFMSTRETALSMDMLRRLDREILIGQISYKQRADIYNDVHGYNRIMEDESNLVKRVKLDRRRLEAAHFKYAILTVVSWYPDQIDSETRFSSDLQDTLLQITPLFQHAFHKKYSGHRCENKGCGTVLVLDGNQKNNRPVCAAEEAGFVEYAGLPGKVKTGCMATPDQSSLFCSLHKPRQLKVSPTPFEGQRGVIEMILRKKETRNAIHYEVLWLGKEMCAVTWEPAGNVPDAIIEEFERGTVMEVTDQVTVTGIGQEVHTLTAIPNCTKTPVLPPTPSNARPVIKENEGAFYKHPDDLGSLQCNTLKDKDRLHHRTAGILAGIWPCGIITVTSELFLTESNCQVYGSIHSFLHVNSTETNDIKFIVYDDGCHLKKFAINPIRSTLTDTSKKIKDMHIVVDKMHFKGHVDRWCQQHCNPRDFEELEEVDTEICEQTFSWLSRYARITRHMNRPHFMFYLLYICDLHNRKKLYTT